MPISGVDFYTQAGDWFSERKSDAEVCLRSVISRAYYGAFLEARDRAGISNQSGSVHGDTIAHYRSRDPTLGNRLESLKELRTQADYKLGQRCSLQDAQRALVSAKKILLSLGAL